MRVGEDAPSRFLVVCAAHRLRYDPALHDGCVVCRREAHPVAAQEAEVTDPLPWAALFVGLTLVAVALVQGRYGPWLLDHLASRAFTAVEKSGSVPSGRPPRVQSTPKVAAPTRQLAQAAVRQPLVADRHCTFPAPGSGVPASTWPLQGLGGAAVRGDIELVVQAAGAGLSLDEREGTVHPPLTWAVLAGRQQAAQAFVARGADVNARSQDGATPLITAARANMTELVAQMLARGAAIDATDRTGRTALMLAARANLSEMVGVLLQHGASIEQRCSRGMTALAHAAEATGCTQAVGSLLAAGAQVDARDARGATPFLLALHAGHEQVARSLLASGARLDARDHDGYRPLDYVVVPRSELSSERRAALDATLSWLLAVGVGRRLELDPAETSILFRERLESLLDAGASARMPAPTPEPPRTLPCVRLMDRVEGTSIKKLRSWLWAPTYAWRAFASAVVRNVTMGAGQRLTLAGDAVGRGSWHVDDVLVIEAVGRSDHRGGAFIGGQARVFVEGREAFRVGRPSGRFAAEEIDLTPVLTIPGADRYVFTALDHGRAALVSDLYLCADGPDADRTIASIIVEPRREGR